MFCAKLLCETIDSLNNFEMLHFHFDRWLYKIVSVILLLIYILVTIAEYATFKKKHLILFKETYSFIFHFPNEMIFNF